MSAYRAGHSELYIAGQLGIAVQTVRDQLVAAGINYVRGTLKRGFAQLRENAGTQDWFGGNRRAGGRLTINTRGIAPPPPGPPPSGYLQGAEPPTPRYPAGGSRTRIMSSSLAPMRRGLKRKTVSDFDRFGSQHITEHQRHLHVNHKHEVLWFGVTSFVARQACVDLGMAFMRWICYSRFGKEFETRSDKISVAPEGPWTVTNQPFYSITFYADKMSQAANGAIERTEVNVGNKIVQDLSLIDFGIWFADQICNNEIWRTDQRDQYKLTNIAIEARTYDAGNPSASRSSVSNINIETMEWEVRSDNTILLQNVTPADDGGETTTLVDANPIYMKRYRLRTPNVVLENPWGQFYWDSFLQTDGVWASADGLLVPGPVTPVNWRQFVEPYIFKPGAYAGGEISDPGAIKREKNLDFYFKGPVNNFLGNLHFSRRDGVVDLLTNHKESLGICELFAFKPVMPTKGDYPDPNNAPPDVKVGINVVRRYKARVYPPKPVLLEAHAGDY